MELDKACTWKKSLLIFVSPRFSINLDVFNIYGIANLRGQLKLAGYDKNQLYVIHLN